jgi:hypothetical protein
LRANGVVHRAFSALRAAVAFACLPAAVAAARLVLEALLCVELLLARSENEFGSAVSAVQRSILKGHNSSSEFHHLEARHIAAANGGCPRA